MHYKTKSLISTLLTTCILASCSFSENTDTKGQQTSFNFSDSIRITSEISTKSDQNKVIRVAVAAITSPRETFTYYKEMFEYIENETGLKVLMTQRKTYEEINNLMKINEIDIAFVCSGGYVFGHADSSFTLLVVPERNGKRVYQTYIIVHESSNMYSFDDLRGKRFAFTDPMSTSGNLYPQKRVKDLGSNNNDFFHSYVYTYAHDNSIQLVSKQMVDGAAVNSLVFDYIASNNAERVKNIRIIEKSGWYGIPPVIASKALPDDLKEDLQRIFLNMHNNRSSMQVLEKLMYDRFVVESDTIFNSVRELL